MTPNILRTPYTQTFMIGKLLGAFVFGAMSDSIGRFKTYFISLILQTIFGIMVAISPNFWLYSLSRLLVGASCSGVYLCAYILALEFVGQVWLAELEKSKEVKLSRFRISEQHLVWLITCSMQSVTVFSRQFTCL